ncbi:MAG: chorismate mutase [Clostridiaceae bacterium]|nr:chorismate mutase [Clostridiaceae bacterium]
MKEQEILRQIIDSCDEALLDVFLRRMEISLQAAQAHLEHQDTPIYDPAREKAVLEHVTSGLSPELTIRARSLWSSLLRMSRGRQYRYVITHDPSFTLQHERDLLPSMPEGTVLCPSNMCREVSSSLHMEASPCHSTAAALEGLVNGKYERAAVLVGSYYETEWLYSMIYNQPVYINALTPAGDGQMVALMSRKLINAPENCILSVAFAIRMDRRGDLAQALSVFSEADLNVEYFRVKTHNIAADDEQRINIVFAELSGKLTSTDTRAALLQLQEERPFFRVIGYRISVLDH